MVVLVHAYTGTPETGSFHYKTKIFKANLAVNYYLLLKLMQEAMYLASEMETGRVDRPVGLPVGSRFFDRPVKPIEKPVKFSFLATKRHLSTNRNLYILL